MDNELKITTTDESSEAQMFLENLHELEFSPIPLDGDIFVTALVAMGLKPASEFSISFFEGLPDYNLRDYAGDISRITEILKALGLSYEITESSASDDEDSNIETTFYVSKNPENAKNLRVAFENGNDDQRARLLGYPDSAVTAFSSSSYEGFPTELENLEEASFLYFVPSKENWQEEIKLLEPQIQAVKVLMPDLYERMLASYRRESQVRAL